VLPEDAFVTRWEGDQRGTVLLRAPLGAAYRTLLERAQQRGILVAFREIETLDAEVDVVAGDKVVRFALSPAPDCQDVTRAVVTKRPA
jgi:hypothetical protein